MGGCVVVSVICSVELYLVVDDECYCTIEGGWVFLQLCCVEFPGSCVDADLEIVGYRGGVVACFVSAV